MSTEEIRAIELLTGVSYGRVATSMRAMPFVAPARHIVDEGRVLLRLHRGLGYHRACAGSVVAYGADNLNSGSENLWSVQFTGTAEVVEPTEEQLAAFGPAPRTVDGEPFDPVYMRIEPRFVTVHALDYAAGSLGEHAGERIEAPDGAQATGGAGARADDRAAGRHLHHAA
ncbi:pyridoxamine 5'-phosphate oxidase family protein [Streptomyces sp. ms191]|uniref:pyridoxamine 5'-phosphate oxidase family protein n=1 Tax=Streptomyces sp. ms191 TaxID=1827978 RepID=UPI0011CDBD5F|nr:pyridoxamine 5'-phosphate oxidase family protein [Streptomyces sp. ms191]TXS30598.1 pyridoxamine 5'-phosphate oxidase family protein [Streptomyces sp. ms191]